MDVDDVVETLAALGFFRFVSTTNQREAREATASALRTRRSLDGQRNSSVDAERSWQGNRIFFADAEGLAEIGVSDFLWGLLPLLSHESVEVRFLADLEYRDAESGATRYDVLVNDERHEIYQIGIDSDMHIWDMSHRRTVEIVSGLLERVGSRERAFGAGASNDASVCILTNELFDYIQTLPLDPAERPQRAAEMVVGNRSG